MASTRFRVVLIRLSLMALFESSVHRLNIVAPARLMIASKFLTFSCHGPLTVGREFPAGSEMPGLLLLRSLEDRVRIVTHGHPGTRRELRDVPTKPVPPVIKTFIKSSLLPKEL